MFKDMKLGVKLGIGFGVLILIAMILGGMAVVNMKGVQGKATILAKENVPEVGVANNIERYSMMTMYEMRGYAYSEEESFLKGGQKNLAEVNKYLQEALALADRSAHLGALKESATKAKEKVAEYEKLAEETIAVNKKLEANHAAMNESAGKYMQNCAALLADQNRAFEKEIAENAGEAKLSERLHKIGLINDVVDQGNEVRVGNFKGQALRDPEAYKEAIKRFDEIDRKMAEIRPLVRQDVNVRQLNEIATAGAAYKKAMEEFLSNWLAREEIGKKRGVVAEAVLEQAKATAMKGMEDVTGIADQAVATLSSSSTIMIAGLAMALVIGIVFAFILTRAITGPMVKGVEFTKQVALGDISANLDVQQKDEIGALAAAMNGMVDNLRKMVKIAEKIADGDLTVEVTALSEKDALGNALKHMVTKLSGIVSEINVSASNVAAGSEQMSSTSQSMSQGATEQASSLEEISSSMNEIASQTKRNAENAVQANKLAGEARDSAEKGNTQMTQMVTAMSDINQSSQSISKIIKVIDEIAFQTNLLALNAAVEAARAGKHGKGFAVVAEEVRNLAARSAKAAKETAELIEGSVKKVEGGTEIATRTAEALKEIVGVAGKVNDLVAEIAAASNEQAQGVSQITQGLGQVDQVTQQNTAHAEESASAAEELSSQAMVLQQLVTNFKLADDKAAVRTAPPAQAQTRATAATKKPAVRKNGNGKGQHDGWGTAQAAAALPEPTIRLDDQEFGKY